MIEGPVASADCADSVGLERELPNSVYRVGATAAMPLGDASEVARENVTGADGQYFAKVPLYVRGSSSVSIRALTELRLSWGTIETHREVSISGCADSDSLWAIFAGGFTVPVLGCHTIVVESDGEKRQFTFGVGAPCASATPR